MAVDISDDYYLVNFEQLIGFVSASYADLLSAAEQAFYSDFTALPENARRLYIRLLCRSRNDFRLDKLNYPDIEAMHTAVEVLADADFFAVDALQREQSSAVSDGQKPGALLTAERWLPLFTKPELLSFATLDPALAQFKSQRREALESYLINEADVSVLQAILATITTLTVKRTEVFLVYRLCFFGNLYQDMTDFVLRDLGLMTFESYALGYKPGNELGNELGNDNTADGDRAFESREQLAEHLEYYLKLEESEQVLEGEVADIEAWCHTLPKGQPNDQTLKRRVDRLRNRVARQLERRDEPDVALRLYQRSVYPPARERRARLHASLEQFDDALAVCADMAATPLTDAESEFATDFSVRVLKRAGHKPEPQVKHQPHTVTLTLPHPSTYRHDLVQSEPSAYDTRAHESGLNRAGVHESPVPESIVGGSQAAESTASGVENRALRLPSVELLCAAHFSQSGTCLYTENTLFSAVTGMVFWDCVFAPIPGAFYNPFQVGPADFSDPGFYQRRQTLIEERLSALNTIDDIAARVQWCLTHKQGRVNPLVQWRYLSDVLLSNALAVIPLSHWLAVFKRILKDPKHNRSGLPDLIHFPSAGGYCLIEVKGPGDRLQKNQVSWMRYFAEHDIPHQVCHVVWANETGTESGTESGTETGTETGTDTDSIETTKTGG